MHGVYCCYKCEDREVGCHSKCERYRIQKEKFEMEKKQIRKSKNPLVCDSDFNSYVGKRTKRYVAKRTKP